MPTSQSVVDVILQLNLGMLNPNPFYPKLTGISTNETLFTDQKGNTVVSAQIPFSPSWSNSIAPFAVPASVSSGSSNPFPGISSARFIDSRQPFVVRASGFASSAATTNLTMALYAAGTIGGAQAFGAVGPVAVNNTSRSWTLTAECIYDPAGTGRVSGQARGYIGSTGFGLAANEFSMGAITSANLITFSVSGKWSADDPSNQITLKNFTIDPL